jgi:hypothetical protein
MSVSVSLLFEQYILTHPQSYVDRLVDWLRWGETDVSELRPLRAYCSSPGDLRCAPWYDNTDWG